MLPFVTLNNTTSKGAETLHFLSPITCFLPALSGFLSVASMQCGVFDYHRLKPLFNG